MSNNSSWGSGPVQARLVCGDLTLAQSELLSFCHTASCCDGDIGLGQVCAATIQATLTGQRDLLGERLTAQLGESSGGSLVWHPLGTFVVTECRRGEDSTALTACDAAWYALAGQYVPTVQSGAMVSAVLADLAGQCSLTVEQTTLNYGLQIPVTGTLTGHSCREMLGYLAALCGRNCVISREGAVRFVWFSTSDAVVTAQSSYAGEHTHSGLSRVAGLRCTVPDGEGDLTLVAGDADKALELACPFMTQSRLEALWTQLGGYQYPTLEVSFFGGAEVQPGDLVTVTDRGGVSVCVPAMEVRLTVDGACRCQLRSFGQSDESRACDRTGPVEQRLRRVQSTADTALLSANGKNKNFYQASAPASSAGLTEGDLWFDTANGNRVSEWTGSAWVQRPFGNAAVANLDAGSITTGTLNAARIGTNSITASKIDVNTLSSLSSNVGTLTGGVIQSANYSSGTSGMKLDLTNGTADITGTIRAQMGLIGEFYIANGGFVRYSGEIGGTNVELIPSEQYSPEDVLCISETVSQGSCATRIALKRNGDIYATGKITGMGGISTDILNFSGNLTKNNRTFLITASRSVRVSCPANGAASGTAVFGPDITSELGYVPFGVVGYRVSGSYSNRIFPSVLYVSGETLYYTIRNVGADDFNGALNVVFLFQSY